MVVLTTVIQLSKWRGAVGERTVRKRLEKLGEEYRAYHDHYVEDAQYGFTQIDHVVNSKYGLHVIETKHYKGWIFGSENQKYWTQIIFKNKQKFYNPIRQNYGHIKALKSRLDLPNLPYAPSSPSLTKSNSKNRSGQLMLSTTMD
ncbi:nuclease-related domain-containing protein [Sporosarcina ureae]|uniref:nuclease-related domain-containing protein n=1 Tax=Sporosarcina ureae TaxID=1571 RepID=UPI0018DEB529|nr:nuclease-related domain-containing protein [Sporosarcina ureae]